MEFLKSGNLKDIGASLKKSLKKGLTDGVEQDIIRSKAYKTLLI